MPYAMQLQPLINLEVCPARLTPATSVAIVGGSCSVCRSDLSAIIAPAQGLHTALQVGWSDVFPVGCCSLRARGDDLRLGRVYSALIPHRDRTASEPFAIGVPEYAFTSVPASRGRRPRSQGPQA